MSESKNARSENAPQKMVYTLESLSHQSKEAFMEIYRNGPAPTKLSHLHGDPAGLILGLDMLGGGRLDSWIRGRARKDTFLWEGKSFRPINDREGTGFNRLRSMGILAAFSYRTSIAPSLIDGRDCIVVDYNVPRNPNLARGVYDELREVSPGLFLGLGTWKRGRIIGWFAVDCNA